MIDIFITIMTSLIALKLTCHITWYFTREKQVKTLTPPTE